VPKGDIVIGLTVCSGGNTTVHTSVVFTV